MNVTQRGVIALMKSAVLQKPQMLPEGFQIQAAMPLIQRRGALRPDPEGSGGGEAFSGLLQLTARERRADAGNHPDLPGL